MIVHDDLMDNALYRGTRLQSEKEYLISRQQEHHSILLQVNGWKSTDKHSQALNVHYFFPMDQIKKGNLSIKYCPITRKIIGDFYTKPLQGAKFHNFWHEIMGEML